MVLRYPLDALKIQNYRTFTPAEIADVDAAADLLRHDMPVITGSRKTVWPSLCAAMDVWSKQLVVDRAVILHIERTRWKQHEECYVQSMLGICLRLRWARETWVRGIFRRLCEQFCVDTAVDLANILIACMTRNNSTVYIEFNLKVNRAYYGMVHERRPHERWEEHWRAVLQHSAGIASETERQYEYMARHGGAASWLFLLYISCGQDLVIERHRLQNPEQQNIGLYPNSLNRMRHSGSPYKAVPKGEHATVPVDMVNDVHVARRKKPGNC